MNPPIRRATAADARAIAEAHVAAWRETYAGLVPASLLDALSVEAREAMWKRRLADSGRSIFVAEGIAGFGDCGPQDNELLQARGYDGEIASIYLLKAFQRRGLGRALMATMFHDLGQRGMRAASLWVLRENAPARQFYERLGGVVVGEKQDSRGHAILEEVAYGWSALPGADPRGD